MKNSTSPPLYTCAHCRGNFKFNNIKYSDDGGRILCLDCYNRIAKGRSQLKRPNLKSYTSKNKPDNLKTSKEIRFVCVDCRYNFSWKKDSRIIPLCPYCGKGNLMQNDDMTAESLLNEDTE